MDGKFSCPRGSPVPVAHRSLSLAPGFSRVGGDGRGENRFNGFSPDTGAKPLKRLGSSPAGTPG